MVVSHSITMPLLCLPHSYYEVACLKKTKKGGGIFLYMYTEQNQSKYALMVLNMILSILTTGWNLLVEIKLN